MKKILKKLFCTAVFTLIIAVSFSQMAYSQSIWVQDYENEATWGIELLVPSYSLTGDQRGTDFASYLYTNIPFGENWGLKLVFPISRYSGSGSKLGSGNPFIGFQYINRDTGIKLDFGGRLPIIPADQYTPLKGLPPIEVFRVGAFNKLIADVHFNFHYRYGDDSGWVYKIGQGLQVVAFSDGPAALLFNYYGQALYKFNKITVGAGLKGHIMRNESHFLFPQQNRLQFGLIGWYDLGRFDFGLYLKKDIISGFQNNIPLVFGFNFRVTL